MIVIAVGYSGTGSSAIVHLLSEYSNCMEGTQGTYEHLPFYTPDGVFDLEDRLLKNNSIHMSDAAIDLFYKAMRRLNDNNFGWFGGYQKRFGNQFMQIVEEFIENITEFTLDGYWSYDFNLEKSFISTVKDTIKTIIKRPIMQFGYKLRKEGDGKIRYSFINEAEFYRLQKNLQTLIVLCFHRMQLIRLYLTS